MTPYITVQYKIKGQTEEARFHYAGPDDRLQIRRELVDFIIEDARLKGILAGQVQPQPGHDGGGQPSTAEKILEETGATMARYKMAGDNWWLDMLKW